MLTVLFISYPQRKTNIRDQPVDSVHDAPRNVILRSIHRPVRLILQNPADAW